jgi:hypothetical protein
VVPPNGGITIPQGGVATLNTNITPLYNYSGTITAICSGLPANSVCRFQPTSLSLSGTAAQTFSVNIYTNVQSTLASVERPPNDPHSFSRVFVAQLLGWPFAAVALFCFGRRKRLSSRMRLLSGIVLLLTLGGGTMALGGCSSGSTTSNSYVTPQGSSTVSVTFSDGAGASQVVTFNFTVSAPYPLP